MNPDMQPKAGFGKTAAFVVLAMLTAGLCSTALIACNNWTEGNYAAIPHAPKPRTITASEARKVMDDYPTALILDVRTEEEFKEGHIPGAVLMPYDEIDHESLSVGKDKPILIYCRSGRRSAIAAQEFIDLGYSRIFDFGGIIDWPYEIEQ